MMLLFCAVTLTAASVGLACFQESAISFDNDSNPCVAVSSLQPRSVKDVLSTAADEEKLTIRKIMNLAHKSGLLKNVSTGKATEAELDEPARHYAAVPNFTPSTGVETSWKSNTDALVHWCKLPRSRSTRVPMPARCCSPPWPVLRVTT